MATARKTSTAVQREVIPGLESVITPAFPPGVSFDQMGVAHTLTITDATTVQERGYDNNELLFWPSGDPKMLLVIIGKDEQSQERSLWIRGARLNGAFKIALAHAGLKGIAVGDVITVTWIDEEEVRDRKGKLMDTKAKLYDVEIQA